MKGVDILYGWAVLSRDAIYPQMKMKDILDFFFFCVASSVEITLWKAEKLFLPPEKIFVGYCFWLLLFFFYVCGSSIFRMGLTYLDQISTQGGRVECLGLYGK